MGNHLFYSNYVRFLKALPFRSQPCRLWNQYQMTSSKYCTRMNNLLQSRRLNQILTQFLVLLVQNMNLVKSHHRAASGLAVLR